MELKKKEGEKNSAFLFIYFFDDFLSVYSTSAALGGPID
jgi:hypothetical protein